MMGEFAGYIYVRCAAAFESDSAAMIFVETNKQTYYRILIRQNQVVIFGVEILPITF